MNGAIAPGASQSVTVRFTPAAAQSYNGVLTISADNTAGPNQMTIVARGVLLPGPTRAVASGSSADDGFGRRSQERIHRPSR